MRRIWVALVGIAPWLVAGCGGDRTSESSNLSGTGAIGGTSSTGTGGTVPDGNPGAGGAGGGGGTGGAMPQPHGCSDLFDQARLMDHSFDISADEWTKMIADAVEQDPHRLRPMHEFVEAVAEMRQVVVDRPAYVAKFLACEDGSGDATDGDGDGFAWCNDCDDQAAAVNPGAAEICGNGIDDNCNHLIDAEEAAAACPPPPPTTPPPPTMP